MFCPTFSVVSDGSMSLSFLSIRQRTVPCLKYRILFGNEYFESDYIFKWENGKPYTPDFVSRKFHKLLEKYEFPIIRFHDLRHSCASLLIANGFSLKDIQEWFGHSDIQTTANIYAHLDVERKNKIANSMSNTLKF